MCETRVTKKEPLNALIDESVPWQKMTSIENKLAKTEKTLEETKKRIRAAEHEQHFAKRELAIQKLVDLPTETAQQMDELSKKDEVIVDLRRKLKASEKSQKQMNDECLRLNDAVFEQSELIKQLGIATNANQDKSKSDPSMLKKLNQIWKN